MSWSRTSLLAVLVAAGLSGCAEDKAAKVAKDPYLPTMMKDPLYTWRPVGDLVRTESLLPRSTDNFASGTAVSRIVIEFHLISSDANTLPQEAQRVSFAAGYVSGDRVLMSGVHVMCSMGILTAGNGIGILMLAPA